MSRAAFPIDRLMKRDNDICWLCHKFVNRHQATRDHVIPYSHGGPNHEANLKLAHRKCNEKRENEVIISEAESIDILLQVQDGMCFRCLIPLSGDNATISQGCPLGSLREIKVVVCNIECEKNFFFPTQKKRMDEVRIMKRIESRRNRIPMEMIVADSLFADQLESGDYVRFYCDNSLRFGIVRDVTDNGDSFCVTIEDDIEGDVENYMVLSDTVFSLLVPESVSV